MITTKRTKHRRSSSNKKCNFRALRGFFENTGQRAFSHFKQSRLDCVIPAWSAGIQADMDVSGRILRTWMPVIHAGMRTFAFLFSVGERKIMEGFVVLQITRGDKINHDHQKI